MSRLAWSFGSAFLLTLVAAPVGAEPSYLGNKKCKLCHLKQYKSWAKTKMSKVFDLLKPNTAAEAKKKAGFDPAKDYTKDAKCLPCHTTGYGKPGGFGSAPKKDKHLTGVGCEMCHGPGSEYVQNDRMSNKNKQFKSADLAKFGFVSNPTKAECAACHNKKNPFHKEFNFEKRKSEGVHEHFPKKYQH